MIRSRIAFLALILASTWPGSESGAQEVTGRDWLSIRVKAGDRERVDTPIRFEMPENRLGPKVREALDRGVIGLDLTSENLKEGRAGRLAQVERMAIGALVRVTFVLPEPLGPGKEARYQLGVETPIKGDLPGLAVSFWTMDESTGGALDLKHAEKMVFRYNAKPVSSPNYGPIQNRDGYIHPAYSPSGALITGDFSSSHPHHRGFFLAYEQTKTGDLAPDFWNIHQGTGKIYSEGIDKPVLGPITARFSSKHRWDAKDKAAGKDVTVLRERWDVEAYAIPGAPYWLFDLTSTQQAVGRPLELRPYRYGGMAYRGPEPFVKGKLDVLTSENLNRKTGDQKPARWVDLTGPVAEGSDKYAGAMIADHPSNPHYPNVARIHPTSLPFFCYVPSHDRPLTISDQEPTVFRYRVLIHDGHPDKALDERIARDFTEPPVVVVE